MRCSRCNTDVTEEANFCHACGLRLVDGGRSRARRARGSGRSSGPDAERRQVTCVMADIEGSTDLSERHDPETLFKAILEFQSACWRVASRFVADDGPIYSPFGR